MIEVPQPDGSIARFPQSAGVDALLALLDGEDHPLAVAVRASEDPAWEKSFYNMLPLVDVEDLSEP